MKKEIKNDYFIFNFFYSEQEKVIKIKNILNKLKIKKINLKEDTLKRVFKFFKKQKEMDFFINKNVKAFLQKQFKLWCYQLLE